MASSVHKKLVIVGDATCGKNCLLLVFAKGSYPIEWSPAIFDNYEAEIEVDQTKVALGLWYTNGMEDYDRLRLISYPHTDVVLICFRVDNPHTFRNVVEKWTPEVRRYCPNVPIVLVGTKKDLRTDQDTIDRLTQSKLEIIRTEQGRAMRKQIGAEAYVECSAKTKEGVREVFEAAARAALKKSSKSHNNHTCEIL